MPEPSGTDTTNVNPAGQGDGNSGATTTPEGQTTQPGAQDASLARENAKWRTQLREAQKQIEQMKAEIETAKQAPPSEDPSEVAQLKRQLSDLQKSFKETQDRASKAEEARKAEKLENALLKAVGDAKLLDPEDAAIVVRTKGKARIADDGKAVFVITDETGEEREVLITPDAIKQHKLCPDRFWAAEGAAGSGARGGARGAAPSGLDYERGLKDLSYFQAHEKEMKEETKRRMGQQ